MLIAADSLSVSRLGRRVLADITLRVDEGECVSIIGPNGAGKSTLMAALLGILPPDSGTVRLDGSPMERLNRRHVARRVAYVPQLHEGYLGFRVRDIAEAARYAHVDPLEPLSPEDRRAVSEALRAAGVDHLADRRVDTLSGGERQKAWIAGALAQETPALFLDEPTNALDPAHQAELIRLMRRLHGAGKTLLVICHDLNLPLALGGRVIAIRDHTIAYDGPVGSLLDVDLLNRVYGTRFELHQACQGQPTVGVPGTVGEAAGWSIQLSLRDQP
jgi:iron complex transport system ATP-binding protein